MFMIIFTLRFYALKTHNFNNAETNKGMKKWQLFFMFMIGLSWACEIEVRNYRPDSNER